MKQARIHPGEEYFRGTSPPPSGGQLYRTGQVLEVFLYEEDMLTKRELEAKRHEESRREKSKPVNSRTPEASSESPAVSTPSLLKLWRGPALCSVEGYDDETCMHVLRVRSYPSDTGYGRQIDKSQDSAAKQRYNHELVKCKLEEREHYCDADILTIRESLDLVAGEGHRKVRANSGTLSPASLAVRDACFKGELPPGFYFVGGNAGHTLHHTLRVRLPLQKLLELRAHSSLRYICPAISLLRGKKRIGEVEIPALGWNDASLHTSSASLAGRRSRESSLESDAGLSSPSKDEDEQSMRRRDPEILIYLIGPPASMAKWSHREHDWSVAPLSFALRPAAEWAAVRAEMGGTSDEISLSDMSTSSVGSTRSRMKRLAAQEELMKTVAAKNTDPLHIMEGLSNEGSLQGRKPKRSLMFSTRSDTTRAYRACLAEAHRALDDSADDVRQLRKALHKKYEKEKHKHSHHAAMTQQSIMPTMGSAAALADIISISGHDGHMAHLMGAYALVSLHDTSETDRLLISRRVAAVNYRAKKTMAKRLVNGAVVSYSYLIKSQIALS